MKAKYLIVKCEELSDVYECDANRTPVCMVADYKDFEANYDFEVYELKTDRTLERIKEYTDYGNNYGMALCCVKRDDYVSDYIVIQRFPKLTKEDEVPHSVFKQFMNLEDDENFDNSLDDCGIISWEDGEENLWWYGEYEGSHISTPF